jgi:hypothetical protein
VTSPVYFLHLHRVNKWLTAKIRILRKCKKTIEE